MTCLAFIFLIMIDIWLSLLIIENAYGELMCLYFGVSVKSVIST